MWLKVEEFHRAYSLLWGIHNAQFQRILSVNRAIQNFYVSAFKSFLDFPKCRIPNGSNGWMWKVTVDFFPKDFAQKGLVKTKKLIRLMRTIRKSWSWQQNIFLIAQIVKYKHYNFKLRLFKKFRSILKNSGVETSLLWREIEHCQSKYLEEEAKKEGKNQEERLILINFEWIKLF